MNESADTRDAEARLAEVMQAWTCTLVLTAIGLPPPAPSGDVEIDDAVGFAQRADAAVPQLPGVSELLRRVAQARRCTQAASAS
jgi:hypothetical protein